MLHISILDDYQNVALESADRSRSRVARITIHLLLSRRTKMGQSELGLMKRSARLVNTSRGPIVDEAALIDSLRNRQIAGAALGALWLCRICDETWKRRMLCLS